jgi:hypothetical protein
VGGPPLYSLSPSDLFPSARGGGGGGGGRGGGTLVLTIDSSTKETKHESNRLAWDECRGGTGGWLPLSVGGSLGLRAARRAQGELLPSQTSGDGSDCSARDPLNQKY